MDNIQITATTLYDVQKESTRVDIMDAIDQYYWNDNGGETDGPSYLIEADELTPEQQAKFALQPISGTRLDGYEFDLHAEKLGCQQASWTGWQAERFALIATTPEQVQEALVETSVERTIGFGEDGPRFSHEDGHFVDNAPWLG